MNAKVYTVMAFGRTFRLEVPDSETARRITVTTEEGRAEFDIGPETNQP